MFQWVQIQIQTGLQTNSSRIIGSRDFRQLRVIPRPAGESQKLLAQPTPSLREWDCLEMGGTPENRGCPFGLPVKASKRGSPPPKKKKQLTPHMFAHVETAKLSLVARRISSLSSLLTHKSKFQDVLTSHKTLFALRSARQFRVSRVCCLWGFQSLGVLGLGVVWFRLVLGVGDSRV